jgi:acetyl-CoA synthetase
VEQRPRRFGALERQEKDCLCGAQALPFTEDLQRMANEPLAHGVNIDSMLQEHRIFPPSAEFSAKAHIGSLEEYERLFAEAAADPETFWARIASELHWFEPWSKVLEWDAPWAKWFVNGKMNLSYNCLDRNIALGRRDKIAYYWEGEPGDTRTLTYGELLAEVERFANALKGLGVEKGNRITIYMGMVPELAIAMLACARIGAVHSVIFGGFSANAIVDRVNDQQSTLMITQDFSRRRGTQFPLKGTVDEALVNCPTVKSVVVYQRTGAEVNMKPGRDYWWHDLVSKAAASCPAEPMDSEDPLYILYTSGSTGKPKGILHTTGGYSVGTYITTKWVFDLKEEDIFWCTADIGWVTGHSYIVYGPLQNGATSLMYEGAPNFPDLDRFWALVEKYKVNVFYTAPTAIRTFIKWGDEYPNRHDLSSLRLLGTVGEPINPEAWMWYRKVIGKERCPIVDTWWQTETGTIMITPLPGAIATKPGSATRPFPGIIAEVVDRGGEKVPLGSGGYLVIKKPWPAMARTIFGDPERYVKQYWSDIPGVYFTGDGARIDKDGYIWVMGRVDDVLNVSGHRLSTMEIESALVAHPMVAEAAVVGRPDDIKGQAVAAFITLEGGVTPSPALKDELRAWVAKEIGSMAKPDDIRFSDQLPKTRSGKIMRRLLRELATSGEVKGDITTLEDFAVINKLKDSDE